MIVSPSTGVGEVVQGFTSTMTSSSTGEPSGRLATPKTRREETVWSPKRPKSAPPSTYRSLTASGSGCLRSAALGFLQVSFRPPSPALGHPRDREEAPDLLPVEGVNAENIADGEIVVGALSDLNLIAGA